jgi:hypothetical protein
MRTTSALRQRWKSSSALSSAARAHAGIAARPQTAREFLAERDADGSARALERADVGIEGRAVEAGEARRDQVIEGGVAGGDANDADVHRRPRWGLSAWSPSYYPSSRRRRAKHCWSL